MSNQKINKVVRIHTKQYFKRNFKSSDSANFMWTISKFTAWPKKWLGLCGQVIGVSFDGTIQYAQDQKFIGDGKMPKECYTVLKKEDYPELYL